MCCNYLSDSFVSVGLNKKKKRTLYIINWKSCFPSVYLSGFSISWSRAWEREMDRFKCVTCMWIKEPEEIFHLRSGAATRRHVPQTKTHKPVLSHRLNKWKETNFDGTLCFLACSGYFYELYFTPRTGIAIKCDNKTIIAAHLGEECCRTIAKDVWASAAADHKTSLISLPCEIPFVCNVFSLY